MEPLDFDEFCFRTMRSADWNIFQSSQDRVCGACSRLPALYFARWLRVLEKRLVLKLQIDERR